jgi:NADH:ubiquinone oxidoreductase subunit 5 (subunit L)/multisubunit Na+/H+ antiporter MnhA subunit
MCHRGHIMLSAEDKQDVKKLSGIMIPVYASIVLALIAVIAVSGSSPQGELVASTAIPADTR